MISDKQRAKRNKQIALKHVDSMRHKNVVNHIVSSAHLTDEHELMKFLICRQLLKEGKEFYTECIMTTGDRADILVLEDLKIIEILHSETEAQFAKKIKRYPADFEIIGVKSDQPWNDKLIY